MSSSLHVSIHLCPAISVLTVKVYNLSWPLIFLENREQFLHVTNHERTVHEFQLPSFWHF